MDVEFSIMFYDYCIEYFNICYDIWLKSRTEQITLLITITLLVNLIANYYGVLIRCVQ